MAQTKTGTARKTTGRTAAGSKAATPAKKAPAKKSTPAKASVKTAAKAAPARQRFQVDDRLTTMSAEALTCRSWGHSPFRMPVPPAERARYRQLGQKIVLFGCRNGCSRVRTIILEAGSMRVVRDKTKYEDPKSYLVQSQGGGRVPRQNSRQAFVQLVDEE